jgi:hypothetical protein
MVADPSAFPIVEVTLIPGEAMPKGLGFTRDQGYYDNRGY